MLPRLLALLLPFAAMAASPPPDYRFKVETLVEGMPQPMQFALAPDGRIFLIEIGGKVLIWKPETRESVVAAEFEVTKEQENGLLGLALDPQFARNGHVYLLRSPKTEIFSGQVLSRFTMRGDTLETSSEKELLRFEEQREQCCHHAGGLRFGPDGCLYISTGDNTNPFGSDGFSPHDERSGKSPWDAQKSASNTNDLRGKILRIRPLPEGGYTNPPGNLFPADGSSGRPEIYVMGCRNPWRFDIDPATNILYFGDVGPDSGGDKVGRGFRGHDEVNQVRKAGFYGWPYFIADNRPYTRWDFTAEASGQAWNPAAPQNASPNNTGARVLPPAQPAWIYYPGGESPEFPIMGKGGRTACAGPVFHHRPEFAKTGGFPEYFDRCLLIYDWSRPYVKWARLGEDSKLAGIENFAATVQVKRPCDAAFGPDGALYILDYGETWGANRDSKLLRISYQYGNLMPVALATAKQAAGREPLTVELSGDGSKDHDGEIAAYEWRLEPGGQTASGVKAKFTITAPGSYRADLVVTDREGSKATASVPVMVGNSVPEVAFESPLNGDFFTLGKPIAWRVAARDVEDGSSAEKPDEFFARTLVSAQWIRSDKKDGGDEQGLTLMKSSDCFNCHAVQGPLVGPSLLDVAAKYRGQSGAFAATVDRVIKGSSGIWGQVGMLPHPQHSSDEVAHMVKWIFALEPGKGGPALGRGLAGVITAPTDPKTSEGVFEVTYTDAGRAPAGALAAKAVVRLRARRVEADLNDGLSGPVKGGSGGCTGGACLGSINHGHHVRFAKMDLTDVGSVTLRASSGNVGGRVELRAGSPEGELLGAVDVPNTGAWDKWVELKTPIVPQAARVDVYAVFVNPGKGGLMNLDWLNFNPK